MVSPDAGGVERARAFAKRLNAPLAIIDKRREEANVTEVMNVVGDVRGRHCLLVDDLIDTAGTLVKGAEALIDNGRIGGFGLCHPRGAVRSGGRQDRGVRVAGSGFYEFDPAFERGAGFEEDQVVVGSASAGGGDQIDSRGDFGQCVVHLGSESRPYGSGCWFG